MGQSKGKRKAVIIVFLLLLSWIFYKWMTGPRLLSSAPLPEYEDTEKRLNQVLDQRLKEFPSSIQVEESGHDYKIRVDRKTKYLQNPGEEIGFPAHDTIEGATWDVKFASGEVRLVAYAIIPPGTQEETERNEFPAIWSPDGTPLSQEELVDLTGFDHYADKQYMEGYRNAFYSLVLFMEVSDDFPFEIDTCRITLSDTKQYPLNGSEWNPFSHIGPSLTDGYQRHWGSCAIKYPIPGSVILDLEMWANEYDSYFIPNVPGTVFNMYKEKGALLAAGSYSYHAERGSTEKSDLFVVGKIKYPTETLEAVMKYSVQRNITLSDEFQLLYTDGSTRSANPIKTSSGWVCYEFHVPDKPVRGFLLKRPLVIRVRLHIPDLKGFPEENRHCRDILNLRYASLPASFDIPFLLFHDAYSVQGRFSSLPTSYMNSEVLQKATIRDVIDRCYEKGWKIRVND